MPSAGKTPAPTTYPQVVNILLRTYATDEAIVDLEYEITIFTQSLNKASLKNAKLLIKKALRFENVYKEHD